MDLVGEIQRGNVGGAISIMNSAPHALNQRDGAGGEFPLHIAVRRGSVELASVMLKNGAKANCSNMHGLTPLHYAARLGNLDMISLLLTHGAFIGQVESFFWTPLHYAVYHGWEAAVTKLLESAAATNGAGQLVNETDSLARSALHVACRQGHLSIAAKLLAHGAQLVKDSSGHSPFYYLAVKEANKENQPDFYFDVDYAASSSATLCSDLRQLYQSGAHSDLTFVVEGLPEANEDGEIPAGAMPTVKEYAAHKAIIHARAPALLKEQAPFRTLQGPNKVSIGGLTHTLFSAILEYIYSGGIEFKETDLDFVFNLAKKGKEFEIDALSNFAESLILSNLSDDNIVSILEAAILFACCPRVENYCRYYIIRNFDKIAGLPGQQEELDKLQASQFVAVLPRLSIVSESNPPITAIEKPPSEFQQNKTGQKLPIGGMPMANPGGYPGAAAPIHAAPLHSALPPSNAYGTPKPAKPKKAKTPKADKMDSPRNATGATARGGLTASSGVAMLAGTPPANPELLTGKTFEVIKKLHKDLMSQDGDSIIFNARVDYEAMMLPDYPWIIKRPMDLGTIWKNLNGKQYKTLAEWSADVRTVWDNARTYNAPESEVYQAAERLSKLMESTYSQIRRSLEIPAYDNYIPKPQEWYFNTYQRHYDEYRNANPQAAQVISAPIVPAYADPYGAPVHGGGALPPPSLAKTPVAPKKTRAAPPMANSPVQAASSPSGAYNPMGGAPNANGANRKRKGDGSDEFDLMHLSHTALPPGGSQQPAPYVNGNYPMSQHVPVAQPVQQQPVAQPVATISAAQQQRLQERLEQLDENQANEVIKILNVQPNAEGEFEILIENMPQETVRILQNYLVSVTGPF